MSEFQIAKIPPSNADLEALCSAEIMGSVWGTSDAEEAIGSLSDDNIIALRASVASRTADPIGYGVLVFRHRLPTAAHEGFGCSVLEYPRLVLLVHPNYRTMGVGSALLRQIEMIAVDRALGSLEVAAEEEFKSFFFRRGYCGVDPRKSYWLADTRLWLLRKEM